MPDTDKTLDARGLNCPLPILRTRKALNTLTAGHRPCRWLPPIPAQ